MKKIFKLYVMLQKNSKSDKNAEAKVDPNVILSALILIAICGALGYVSHRYLSILEIAGEGQSVHMVLLLAGALISVGIVFMGGMRLINSMYMSSDIEVLITMPFSGTQIAILRVFSFFQLALIASLGIFIASCIGLALADSMPPSAWLIVIVTAILLPVFVTSVLASLIILLLSVLKIIRSRETLRVIGTIIAFTLFCTYYLFTGNNSGNTGLNEMLMNATGMMDKVKYVVPIIGFADDFRATGNIMYLIFEILSTLAALLIFFVIAKFMYLRGAMSMQDAGRGKLLTDEDLDRYCTRKTALKALAVKEFRMTSRSPVYMLYNFIIGALWPVVVVLALKRLLPMVNSLIEDGTFASYNDGLTMKGFMFFSIGLSMAMLFIVSIPTGMQTLAYSSLSREGKSFPIMKQIPVAYETQIEAKRRMALKVAQISVTGYSILILIAVSIFMKLSILYSIIPLIMVILSVELHVDLDLYLGIQNANVNWDDEKTITNKPTITAIVTLYAGMFTPLILVGLMVFGCEMEMLNLPICFGITLLYGLIHIVLILVLRRRIPVVGVKKIRKLRF